MAVMKELKHSLIVQLYLTYIIYNEGRKAG